MIQSMTAFARQESQGDWGVAVWELRTVNHRYLEMNIRLPDTLVALEMTLRELVKAQLQRGKIEINLRYKPFNHTHLTVNKELAQQFLAACYDIKKLAPELIYPNSVDVLRWPGVLNTQELTVDVLQQPLLTAFDLAMKNLIKMRSREGEALEEYIEQRLKNIELNIAKVNGHLPKIISGQREKLLSRLHEFKNNLDLARLEQEILLFSQKIDVAEELSRLHAHTIEMHRTLQEGGAVGRRLDFLLQELNREANTLAAKSASAEITMIAVELKVLIEQMREQVQNIE